MQKKTPNSGPADRIQGDDVFISYAREDQEFVRRLHDALASRGRQAWVDWEGIPPSAEWMKEIEASIEAADSFIFVLSPASAASRVCGVEAEHAARHRKRLIPVVHRDVDGEVPEAVAKRNWIFFRDYDDFDASTEALVRALDTDLEWVRDHTRLLVRAREWDEQDRDRAFLLRGKDLEAAERWLAEAESHAEPKPTPLHGEYVLAGRRAASRGERRRLVAVAGALIVSLSLAVFALFQWNEAVRQRDRAEQEARIRQSREVAASSLDLLDVDPELSLLLAGEAARIESTPQAEIALRRALVVSRVRLAVGGSTHILRAAALSPEGDRMATAGQDGTVRIWDPATGRGLLMMRGHDGPVNDVEFTSGGERLVSAGNDGTVRTWDATSGASLAVLEGQTLDGETLDEPLTTATLSPDSQQVLTTGVGPAALWDATTGEVLRGASLGESFVTVNDAEFSPEGDRVVTGSDDDRGRIWDLDGENLATLAAHRDEVISVAFGPDGATVVTASADGTARIWDAGSGMSIGVLRGHQGPVNDATFSPDGRLVLTGGADGTARIWDADEQTLVLTLLTQHSVVAAAFDPDGDRVMTTGADGATRIWEVDTQQAVAAYRGHSGAVSSADISPAGDRVVTAGTDGTARIWDAASGDPRSTLQGHEQLVTGATFSPDGDRVVTAGADGTARIWDTSTGETLSVLGGHAGSVLSATWSPDGSQVLTAAADGVARIWDVDTEEVVASTGTGRGTVAGAAFSPDGREVVIFGDLVFIWEPEGDRYTELGPTAHASSAVFTTGGDRLATAERDGTARIWNAATADPLVTLSGHQGAVTDAAFSSDGDQVVTAGADGTVRIWKADTGELFLTWAAHQGPVSSAAFGRSSTRVLTAGADGRARMWACPECAPLGELLELSERRVTRELTAAERLRYLD